MQYFTCKTKDKEKNNAIIDYYLERIVVWSSISGGWGATKPPLRELEPIHDGLDAFFPPSHPKNKALEKHTFPFQNHAGKNKSLRDLFFKAPLSHLIRLYRLSRL